MAKQQSAKKSLARRQALQVLYQSELTNVPANEILFASDADLYTLEDVDAVLSAEMGPIEPFAISLIEGVAEHLDEIDEKLAAISTNWSLARMSIVDRNTLRIASYEIFYIDEVPTAVAINEAVELSKAFGTDESSKFVNGVLGRVAELFESEQKASEE